MTNFFFALIGAALVNNLILGTALAADAVRQVRVQALGPASAVLIAFAAPLAWLLQQMLLAVALPYLFLLSAVVLLAALAWCVPLLLTRLHPSSGMPDKLWPALIINGLGAMLLARSLDGFSTALALGIGGGLGFWLVLQLMNDLFERLEQCAIPAALRGTPMQLICAGLMGLAFLGFNGLGAA